MKSLSCASARRRLQAFHDDELGVVDQIAVGAHLDGCHECAANLGELRLMRSAFQSLAPSRRVLSNERAAAFTATVVSRLKAEDEASLFGRVRGMFDDMHFVYAGLGAAAASMVCVLIMLGMMRFATRERPDSLAAIVNGLATPLECEWGNEQAADAAACRARWVDRFQRANEFAEEDALFALEAVLTQEERLPNLAVLRAGRHHAAAGQVKMIEMLMDDVSRSRLDAVQAARAPVTSNMLWLVEHATVRANKPVALDVPLPPKKRAASVSTTAPAVRA